MGACFVNLSLPGVLGRDEVKREFAKAQDEDRYENGHSYSGGIGMASGLEFVDLTFDSNDAAYEWLSEHAQKWEEAKAVRFKALESTMWMIGAWCAS